MNNKLSENLKKIRKDNNLSQEQLAEKLNVSRQAISKWESSIAYPEMDKIIQLCEMFDLNMDDLLQKDIREVKGEEISKNNLNKYIDEFLKFITNTIDLFIHMTFKSKIKCLLEQIVIFVILFTLFAIIGNIGLEVIWGLFYNILPKNIYHIIQNILSSIYLIITTIALLVIMIHIFKTRYLDYYEQTKKIEQEQKIDLEQSKNESSNPSEHPIHWKKEDNKIIIRDPNHSQYKFINALLKLIIGTIKILTLFFTFFLCFILVISVTLLIFSFTIIKTGLFFIGIFLSLLAISTLDLITILFLFNFIFNRKNNKKTMIWTFLLSVIILGIGMGFISIGILDFNPTENLEKKTLELEMNDHLFFHNDYKIDYIESTNSNIKIQYKINKVYNLKYQNNEISGIYFWISCSNPFQLTREWIHNLNQKKIITTTDIKNIKVYTTKENIEKIKFNQTKYYETLEQNQNIIDNYEQQLEKYREQITNYENQTNELQNKIREYETANSNLEQ